MVILMLPLACIARGFYRRRDEGKYNDMLRSALLERARSIATEDKSTMTSKTDANANSADDFNDIEMIKVDVV